MSSDLYSLYEQQRSLSAEEPVPIDGRALRSPDGTVFYLDGRPLKEAKATVDRPHILFIASGAFQLAKPSDLLPELQGRLPIRVELDALTSEDFKRILKEKCVKYPKNRDSILNAEKVQKYLSNS